MKQVDFNRRRDNVLEIVASERLQQKNMNYFINCETISTFKACFMAHYLQELISGDCFASKSKKDLLDSRICSMCGLWNGG